MNKNEELDKLKGLIKELGMDSYCGPWLNNQLPFIESAIRSDMDPSVYCMTLQEYREHRDSMMDKAKSETAAVIEKATERAKEIIATADKYRDGCIKAVSKALYELRK